MEHIAKIKRVGLRYVLVILKTALILLCTCGLLLSCGSSNKVPQNGQTLSEFINFVDQKSFEFNADTAHPMPTQAFNSVANAGLLPPGSTAGAIQLIGIYSYVKIYGDSVAGILPFYGERRFGGGLMSKSGIEFKGIPDSYEQSYNKAKAKYEINFEISSETGQHQVNMNLFPNKSADVLVTGNQRNTIRYRGRVVPIENEQ